jgi:hypothetical protein
VANPTPTPTGETAKAAAPEVAPTIGEKAADKSEKGKSVSGKGDKGRHKGGETASGKGTGDSKKGGDTASAGASSTPQPTTGSAKSTGKGKGAKSLDDLLGEVGNKKGGDEGPKPAAASKPLISLTQSDIVSAMKNVQPKVQACANQFKVPGTAMASISVASGGKVNSATVTGKFAGTPTGSCVEAAAKSAKFPPCQSMTFPWPFTLSPR